MSGLACAVIGLGEAGALYARALAALGGPVAGFDPGGVATPEGVERADTIEAAVRNADLVVVLTGAAVAERVAREAAPHLKAGACYADFTSSAPAAMRRVADAVDGALMADVAVLGAVPLQGARTPLIASGPGAARVGEVARRLGAPVEVLEGEPPGAATAHKLLRSVYMKGLAQIIWEAITASRAAGAEEWLRGQIAATLGNDGPAFIERELDAVPKHAERRAHELGSVASYLDELGVPHAMSDATRAELLRIASEG
jgi:3-hydroxyisobutyrate dehydrogenase